MYIEYYGLKTMPFQLTPDCQFFFESQQHERAIAHLIYGLTQEEGFIVITGEIGAGKTKQLLPSLSWIPVITAPVISHLRCRIPRLKQLCRQKFGNRCTVDWLS